jgi:hypothetical protein
MYRVFGVRRLDGAFGGIEAILVIPQAQAKSGVEPPHSKFDSRRKSDILVVFDYL